MGITAVLALLLTLFAYIAQSPRALMRLGLAGYRLDLRIKLFTGYALASLILMLGFFLAGVPLGESVSTTAVATPAINEEITESANADSETDVEESGAMGELPQTAVDPTNSSPDSAVQTPASGAFGGPPPGSSDEIATETASPRATPELVGPSPTPGEDEVDNGETAVSTPIPTDSATATSSPTPTVTATPLPTATPSPTITPTPIEGPTGTINTNGSTLWVRRSPGGQSLVIVQDNEIVLVENGRANFSGILWREIRTTSGILGWVQAEFLEE